MFLRILGPAQTHSKEKYINTIKVKFWPKSIVAKFVVKKQQSRLYIVLASFEAFVESQYVRVERSLTDNPLELPFYI